MRLIIQNEVSECGYACLAMALSHFGYNITIKEIRDSFPLSAHGISMYALADIADKYNLESAGISFSEPDLKDLKKGTIIYLNNRHFVVFNKFSGSYVHLYDPSQGKLKVHKDVFFKLTTGYGLEFSVTEQFQPRKYKNKFSAILSSIKYYQGNIFKDFAGIILVTLFAYSLVFLLPYFGKMTIDSITIYNNIDYITILFLGFLSIILIIALAEFIRDYMVNIFTVNMGYQVFLSLFKKLNYLSISYFQKRTVADILARIKEQDTITQIFAKSTYEFIVTLFAVIVTLGLIFYYSVILGFIVVLLLFCYALVIIITYPIILKYHRGVLYKGAQRDSVIVEAIKNVSQIKINSKEHNMFVNFIPYHRRLADTFFKFSLYQNIRLIIIRMLFYFDTIIFIYIAARLLINDQITLGAFYIMTVYKSLFSNNLSQMISSISAFLMIKASSDRLRDIAEATQEFEGKVKGAEEINKERQPFKQIEIKNFSFAYEYDPQDRESYILKDINMVINKGEKICIMGSTGNGKSTLLRLICSLINLKDYNNLYKGDFYLNNKNYNEYNLQVLRSYFSVLYQEDELLQGSIQDNVVFFDKNYDRAKLIKYLQLVNFSEDISTVVDEYSFLQNHNMSLSSGQKQKLLIARTLYNDRDIVILDEPTSNLDHDNSEKILKNIIGMEEKTIIVVTHDHEFANYFEKCYQIENGVLKQIR